MSNFVNPQIQINIFTEFGKLIYINDDIEIKIDKDLDEEPNEARVIIHNLNPSNRQSIIDAGKEKAQLEIWLTQWGSTELVLAYAGEIDHAHPSIPLTNQAVMTKANQMSNIEPGLQMTINCTAQKQNHRAFFVEPRNFSKGTEIASVINWLADNVGLPKRMGNLPKGKMKFSYSFSGLAFKLLKQYIFDWGLVAYILDGTLIVTDVYSPIDTVPLEIDSGLLFSSAEPTTRSDVQQMEIRTVRLNKAGDISKKRRRRKLHGPSEYISTNSVDTDIQGRIYELPCHPTVNPDMPLLIQNENTRTQRILHECDNLHDRSMWQTTIEADMDVGSV